MIRMKRIAPAALLPALLLCGHANADLIGVLEVSNDSGFSESLYVQGVESSASTVTWAEQLIGENFLVAITRFTCNRAVFTAMIFASTRSAL